MGTHAVRRTSSIRSIVVAAVLALLATTLLASPAGAAQPDTSKVFVRSVTYGGSGCPKGTVAQVVSDDGMTATLNFGSYLASTGQGVPTTEARKNCQINLNLQVPAGVSYSTMTIDYRGFVRSPAGTYGEQKSIYYRQGEVFQASSGVRFNGPVAKDYIIRDTVPVSTVALGCGELRSMNANTMVLLAGPPSAASQMTLDSVEFKLTPLVGLALC